MFPCPKMSSKIDFGLRLYGVCLMGMLALSGISASAQSALVANDDSYLLDNSNPRLLDLMANDSNARGIVLSITAEGQVNGELELPCGLLTNTGDGAFIFEPVSGYVGTCSFNYQLSDGYGQVTAAVVLTLTSTAVSNVIVSANAKNFLEVQQSPSIDLNAYHLIWSPPPDGSCDGDCDYSALWQQVDGILATENGKPVIVSSDGAGAIWTALIEGIQDRVDAYPEGTRHFEHFDQGFNQFAMIGYIDDESDWCPGVNNRLHQLGLRASNLEAFGQVSVQGNQILWNEEPVTLMGFSLYGMLSTSRHNLEHYLDKLADNGVNFTREWCIDQWTGQAIGGNAPVSACRPPGGNGYDELGRPGYETALNPFAGDRPHNMNPPVAPEDLFNLEQFNQTYFNRLRTFVELAWERGIVVQISLFDNHGLRNTGESGRWKHSPYNDSNNHPQDYLDIGTATYPVAFTGQDDTAIGQINRAFVRKVVETLRPYGNVIFEVMNEPNPGLMGANALAWHEWVAGVVRSSAGAALSVGPVQPASVSAQVGGSVTFSVQVNGGTQPYSYQWLFNNTPLQGAPNQATLVLNNLGLTEAGDYACRVTDVDGSQVTSQAAMLTVIPDGLQPVASIDLGTVDQGTHLLHETRPALGQTVPADIGGRNSRTNMEPVPGGDDRMYFTVTDNWGLGVGPEIDIRVTYYDTGAGFLKLIYDGQNQADETRAYTIHPETVAMGDTNQWHTHTWRIRDGEMAGDQSYGADFNIVKSDAAAFYLDLIEVVADPLRATAPQNQTVTPGVNVSFESTVTGGTGNYFLRWQFANDALGPWEDLSDSDPGIAHSGTNRLQVNTALTAASGHYRLKVEDQSGSTVYQPFVSPPAHLNLVDLGPHGSAFVDLGDPDVGRDLFNETNPPKGQTVPVLVGGRQCRTNEVPGSGLDDRMYFEFDNNWQQGQGSSFDLTITYFDTGNGFLELIYDGLSDHFERHPEKIYLQGSSTWRTHTWAVDDGRFTGGQNYGADFQVFKSDGLSFYIDTVQVVANPLRVSSPADLTVVHGESAHFAVSQSGGSGQYWFRWQFRESNGAAWIDLFNGSGVLGAPTNHLQLNTEALAAPDGQYRLQLSDKLDPDTYPTVYSSPAQLNLITAGNGNIATVDLGDPDLKQDMFREDSPALGKTIPVTVGGRQCRTNKDPAPGDDDRMFFELAKDWEVGFSGVFTITMSYFDSGSGDLRLVYDTAVNDNKVHPVWVPMQNTGTWLTHAWEVTDAEFANGQNGGADFFILKSDGQSFFLDVVSVAGDRLTTSTPEDQNIARGEDALFSTTATGGVGPYSYRWFYSQTGGEPWTMLLNTMDGIVGSPTSTLRVKTAVLSDPEGFYRCRVRDADYDQTGIEVFSGSARLNLVIPPLVVTNAVPVLAEIAPGGSASFSVTAWGGEGSLSFQWEKSINGSSGWSAVAGPQYDGDQSPLLTIGPGAEDDSGWYRCRVWDQGTEITYSTAARLDVAAVNGSLVTLDLGPTITGTGLDLTEPANGETVSTSIASVASRKLAVPYDDIHMYFKVDDNWQSEKRRLTVTASYYDLNEVGGIRLHYNRQGGGSGAVHGHDITFAGTLSWKTASWHIDDADFRNGLTNGADFRINRKPGGPGNLYLDQVQVTTMQVDRPSPINPTVVEGNLVHFDILVVSSQGGHDYQWFRDEVALIGQTGSRLNLGAVNATDQGSYTCLVRDNAGSVVMSRPSVLTVTPANEPLLVSGPGSLVVIERFPYDVEVVAVGGVGNYQYQWEYREDGTQTWRDLIDTEDVTGTQTAILHLEPALLEYDDYQLRCRVDSGSEFAYSSVEILNVLPFDTIETDLGNPDLSDRLVQVSLTGSNGESEAAFWGGRWCKQLAEPLGQGSDENFRMFFKVDDQWAIDGNRPVVDLTVTYYDRNGQGHMSLQYHGGSDGQVLTHPDEVEFTGTNTFRTHTWHLENAFFGNGMSSGADFRLVRSASGAGDLIIDKVILDGALLPLEVPLPSPGSIVKDIGQSVSFEVFPLFGIQPYHYQWVKDGVPMINGPEVGQWAITNLSPGDAGAYACTVIDALGEEITSEAAVLTIYDGQGVSVDLGDPDLADGVQLVEPAGTGNAAGTGDTTVQTFDGREARRCRDPEGNDDGVPDRKMWFKVNDSWASGRSVVSITVTYFDTGAAGKIYLTYQDRNGNSTSVTGQPIQLQGAGFPAGQWRSFTWNLSNVDFSGAGMASGADFFLERDLFGSPDRRWLVIDSVVIE